MTAAALRVQPGAGPAGRGAGIEQALVQAAGAAVPEFQRLRHQAEAAPEGWAGHRLSGEPLLDLAQAGVEHVARRQVLALVRRPRADLALARPAGKIPVR